MVKKQKEKISFSIGSGQQVGATESRQKMQPTLSNSRLICQPTK